MSNAEVSNVSQRTSGLAIASLILSCCTIFLGPFGCIPGIICGHIARSGCRKDPNVGGEGLALAGLIIGYVLLAFFVLAIPLYIHLCRPNVTPVIVPSH